MLKFSFRGARVVRRDQKSPKISIAKKKKEKFRWCCSQFHTVRYDTSKFTAETLFSIQLIIA